MSAGPYTRALAQHSARSRYDDLPAAVVEHATPLVLDTRGVGIHGTTLPGSERPRASAAATGASGRVSVGGSTLQFAAPTAAMVDGTGLSAWARRAAIPRTRSRVRTSPTRSAR